MWAKWVVKRVADQYHSNSTGNKQIKLLCFNFPAPFLTPDTAPLHLVLTVDLSQLTFSPPLLLSSPISDFITSLALEAFFTPSSEKQRSDCSRVWCASQLVHGFALKVSAELQRPSFQAIATLTWLKLRKAIHISKLPCLFCHCRSLSISPWRQLSLWKNWKLVAAFINNSSVSKESKDYVTFWKTVSFLNQVIVDACLRNLFWEQCQVSRMVFIIHFMCKYC